MTACDTMSIAGYRAVTNKGNCPFGCFDKEFDVSNVKQYQTEPYFYRLRKLSEERHMAHRIRTTIQQIEAKPGQRLLVVSDIHGHLDRFIQLLRQMHYSGDDILVLVGDLIEKGPESLRVVQYVMDLAQQHPVYVSMGNVDLGRKCSFDQSIAKGTLLTNTRTILEFTSYTASIIVC